MTGAPTDRETRHVLVVTDDPWIVDQARSGFPTGVSVEVALDSREASKVMKEHGAPSVVVVDLQTGSAGGFALAKDMAQSHDLEDVPIVMLLERDADVWLARQAGVSRCLVKPLAPGDVAREALDAAASRSTP